MAAPVHRDDAVTAEVTKRRTLPERMKISLISVAALPDDAKPGAKPTDADFARAEVEANDISEALKGGAGEFFEKPYQDQALLDAIHSAIQRDARSE